MKALGQILFYLVATVLIGALLAPALYWSAHLAANHLHSATIDDFLGRTDFTRFFHRAMTVSALALLWPLLRMLRIENFAFDLGLVHDRRGWKRLLAGFLIATIPTLVLAGILLMTGAYRIHSHIDLTKAVLFPLIAAVATSLLEEFLFRGALQGAVRRTAVDSFAVISVAVLFAVVHFLTPQTAEPAQIHWWSGLALLPDTFSQFRQPGLLLLGFTSLLIVGLILGYARLKTRSLWMPIGLHAGWVLCKMSLMEIVRHPKAWPWIGPDIVTGIGPLVTLLATGGAVWWLLKDTRS